MVPVVESEGDGDAGNDGEDGAQAAANLPDHIKMAEAVERALKA